MISSRLVQDWLQEGFAQTRGGVVELTDQLLAACVGGSAEFERIGDRLICRWTANGDTQEAPAPLPPAAFRTILARVAALCNEHNPNSVSPYGGQGVVVVSGTPSTALQVRFINTSNEQRLEVRGNVDVDRVAEKRA